MFRGGGVLFRGMLSGSFGVFFRGGVLFFGFLAFKFNGEFIAETKALFPAFHFVASVLSGFLVFAEIEN